MGQLENIEGLEDLVNALAGDLKKPLTEEQLRAILIKIFANHEVIDRLDDDTKNVLKNQLRKNKLPCPEGL
jgi:hypothetical protein